MSLTADLALVLARAVAPLERALTSGAAMAALLGDLGWLVGTPPPETGHEHHHEQSEDDHEFPPANDYVLDAVQQAAAIEAFGVIGALRTLLTIAERLGRGEDVAPQAMDAARALFVLLGALDGNDSSTAPFDDPQLWAQLNQELPDYLLIRYLQDYEPGWLATLTVLGLVESTAVGPSAGRIPTSGAACAGTCSTTWSPTRSGTWPRRTTGAPPSSTTSACCRPSPDCSGRTAASPGCTRRRTPYSAATTAASRPTRRRGSWPCRCCSSRSARTSPTSRRSASPHSRSRRAGPGRRAGCCSPRTSAASSPRATRTMATARAATAAAP